MAKSKKQKKNNDDPNSRVICRNRKARMQYDLVDEMECGIILAGSEVKSVRNNKVSIEEAYARVRNGEVWLVGCNISEYPQATVFNHDPDRARKLLMRRAQIRKFAESASQKGLTLVPTAMYLKNGYVKVSIAIGKGRKLHDKRDKLRKHDDTKSIRAAMMKRQ